MLQIAVAAIAALATTVRADIFQWEYINPADPSQGKRQSTTLAPDGTGVDVGPHANLNLAGRDLTMAYLESTQFFSLRNICGDGFCQARLNAANLTATNLTRADLTKARFGAATLTDADFTGADIIGASFGKPIGYLYNTGNLRPLGNGIAIEQIYSTASYQARDLSAIDFSHNYFAGANFVGQNLAHASFYGAFVAGADFTGAEVHGANFGKHFNEDVTTSPIQTFFSGSGISLEQLYSTASYQAHDLSTIDFSFNYFAGANFAGQNLAHANFSIAWLAGADFTGAEVRGADFSAYYSYPIRGSGISLEQLSSTASYQEGDIRGINGIGDPTAANMILPNGHIQGVDLDAGGLLVVRDYDGNPTPIPVTVDQHLAMGPGGTLRMVFEADSWDSTISFAPGIPVTLGGTLDLTFANDVNLASQIGRTFDLFDWTGVDLTGAFAFSSPYTWDLSNLYTTGEVTLTAIPEPHTISLFGFGLATLVSARRVVWRRSGGKLQAAVRLFPLIANSCVARPDLVSWHRPTIQEVLCREAEALLRKDKE